MITLPLPVKEEKADVGKEVPTSLLSSSTRSPEKGTGIGSFGKQQATAVSLLCLLRIA